MSVQRQANLLGQQRLDVPHIRAIESSIAADFDVLAGRAMSGGRPLVVRGFTLANTAVGTSASAVQLATADSILFNLNATEAGTIFWVPADRAVETLNSATNTRVDGSFTVSQVNYVGLDLSRTADDSTSDLVQFLDANTLLENPRNVPLGRTLDYRIVISTTPFSSTPNIIPIARITTNSQNQVASVDDARNLMYRLAEGGDFPDQYGSFSWPASRTEYDPDVANLATLNKFSGGDKDIRSQKDWMDAVMSRLWEVGGGQHWYSETADRNLKIVGSPSPAVFASTSDNFEWGIEAGVPATGLYAVNHLHWQGLQIIFENSDATGVYYNWIADQLSDDVGTPATAAGSKTALAVGECIYVDIDRTSNATVTAQKATLQSMGSPDRPGSRVIIAWRTAAGIFRRDSQHPVNTSYPVATTGAPGSVRLAYAAGAPATPTVSPLGANNQFTVGIAAGYLVTGNTTAITGQGSGSGAGGKFFGGATGGGIEAYGTGYFGGYFESTNSSAINSIVTIGNGHGIEAYGGGTGAGGRFLGGGSNGKGVETFGTGTGAAIEATGNTMTAGSYTARISSTLAGVHGLRIATAGAGLGLEIVASGLGVDALKVATGVLRARYIEDSGSGGAGDLYLGPDDTKTHAVNIGNLTYGVNLFGNLVTTWSPLTVHGNFKIDDSFPGNARVPAANDFGYNTARTFKKTITPNDMNIQVEVGTPTWDQYFTYNLGLSDGPSIIKNASGAGTDQVIIGGQFGLPKGAIITGASIKVNHAGSATCSAFTTLQRVSTPAADAAWSTATTELLTSATVAYTVGAQVTKDFALALTATVADRTVTTDNQFFTFSITFIGTGAQIFWGLFITYTLSELTPACG